MQRDEQQLQPQADDYGSDDPYGQSEDETEAEQSEAG